MAHLSGTFSSPYAGKLRCTLSGVFWQGTGRRDAGFPGAGSGVSNIMVVGAVNGNQVPAIDRTVPTSELVLDYPGGSASWSVSTSTLATRTAGLDSYGIDTLRLVLQLTKK